MRVSSYTILVLVAGGLAAFLPGCGKTPMAEDISPAVLQVKKPAPQPAEKSAKTNPSDTLKSPDGEGFPYPGDNGGRLLARRLAPDQETFTGEAMASKPPLPERGGLDHPAAAMLPSEPSMPQPTLRPGKELVRPGPLREESPLVDARNRPQLPPGPDLPVGERIRVPSPDVNQPVPLAPLAQPVSERPGQEDPTADFSQAAVRATPLPVRANPAPFERLTLPDPFEHRQTVRLTNTPAEEAKPVTASPRLPGK
jgi:hypothetical protein